MVQLIRRFARFIWLRLPDVSAGALFSGILVLAWLQVFRRYVLQSPAVWTEEIARLLLVWATFLAAASACRSGELLGVDIFVRRLPVAWQRVARNLIEILVGITGCVLLYYGIGITRLAWSDTSTSLGLSRGLFYLPVAVGGLLMVVYSGVNFVLRLGGHLSEREELR